MIAKRIAQRLAQQQPGVTLDQVMHAIYGARIGFGVAVFNKSASEGINIEKWPEHDEWYWKVSDWPYGDRPLHIEDEEDLENWIRENFENRDFTTIENYRITNQEGQPIKLYQDP